MTKRFWMSCFGFAALLTAFACGPAAADETVNIGGSRAVLIKPKAPHGSVILMPGGNGAIRAGDQGDIHGLNGNQLVRTRHAYAARGLAVLVVDADTNLGSAVEYMAAIKRPVTVIGTSRGTLRAAQGIARGARPDALVLTSGFLSRKSGSSENVMAILGSPSTLPHTLVIHHSARFLQGDIARRRRAIHQMVGRPRASELDQRRERGRRRLRSRWSSRLRRPRRSGRKPCRGISLIEQ